MRKAVLIAIKSRRGIPLHWNERCQHKNNTNYLWDLTITRRMYNRKARNKAKHQIRSFCGDWEDFTPIIIPKDWLD